MASTIYVTVLCILASVITLTGSYAKIIGRFDNAVVKLYSGIYYNDPLLTLNIRTPNRCYNIDCSYLDDKVASAKWTGLPTTGISGKAYIVFHEDINCGGNKMAITLPHFGGIRDFSGHSVDGKISSFMVLSQSTTVDNGQSEVCNWVGSDVVGGSASEDNISGVNATV